MEVANALQRFDRLRSSCKQATGKDHDLMLLHSKICKNGIKRVKIAMNISKNSNSKHFASLLMDFTTPYASNLYFLTGYASSQSISCHSCFCLASLRRGGKTTDYASRRRQVMVLVTFASPISALLNFPPSQLGQHLWKPSRINRQTSSASTFRPLSWGNTSGNSFSGFTW